MAETLFSFNLGKHITVGWYKEIGDVISYQKIVPNDGTLIQIWKLYIWFKN